MRLLIGFVIILCCCCQLAIADGAVTADTSPQAQAGDQQLMRWTGAKLVPVHETDLAPMVQYLFDIKLLGNGEVVAETEIACIEGVTATISTYSGHPIAPAGHELSHFTLPDSGNFTFVVINSPESAFSEAMLGGENDWLDYWESKCHLELNELSFDIYHPEADMVEIKVEKMVRPPMVIDDQEGNIVLESHYPLESEPEFYGSLSAPINTPLEQYKSFALVVTQTEAGKVVLESELQFFNDPALEFKIDSLQTREDGTEWGSMIAGYHSMHRAYDPRELSKRFESGEESLPFFVSSVGFIELLYYSPRSGEIKFDLYELADGAGDDWREDAVLVESTIKNWHYTRDN